MWKKQKKITSNIKIAYVVVALTWLFDILLVSITVALNTHPSKGQYEMGPVVVSVSFQLSCLNEISPS